MHELRSVRINFHEDYNYYLRNLEYNESIIYLEYFGIKFIDSALMVCSLKGGASKQMRAEATSWHVYMYVLTHLLPT